MLPPSSRRTVNAIFLFLTIAFWLFLSRCKSDPSQEAYTESCGSYTFSSTTDQPPNFKVPENRTEVHFTFDAGKCGITCSCQQIAFVQMIRFMDQTDEKAGAYFQPYDKQKDRMVAGDPTESNNGWAIDRGEDRKFGFVGRNNDGNWDDLAHDPSGGLGWHIQLGSSNRTAIFKDAIHSETQKYLVSVVIVPVCIDPNASCSGKILGYFGYLFSAGGTPQVVKAPVQGTYNWMVPAFDLAVARWNAQSSNEKLNLHR